MKKNHNEHEKNFDERFRRDSFDEKEGEILCAMLEINKKEHPLLPKLVEAKGLLIQLNSIDFSTPLPTYLLVN